MTEDTKKELLKAYHYGFEIEKIAEVIGVSEEEVKKTIEENPEFLKELEARDYGNN
jgi:DNA-directed RNA polymerase specialized sigma24 family protein